MFNKINLSIFSGFINIIEGEKYKLEYLEKFLNIFSDGTYIFFNITTLINKKIDLNEFFKQNNINGITFVINDIKSLKYLDSGIISSLNGLIKNGNRILFLLESEKIFLKEEIEFPLNIIDLKNLLSNESYKNFEKKSILNLLENIAKNFTDSEIEKLKILKLNDVIIEFKLTETEIINFFKEIIKEENFEKSNNINIKKIENKIRKSKKIENENFNKIKKIDINKKNNLKLLKKELNQQIIGQTESINEILNFIYLKSLNLLDNDANKIVNIMLLGSTGVGKTKTIELLSQYLFGENKMITIKGNEIIDETGIYSIFGANPQYTGFGKTETIVDKIKKIGDKGIILIDELEKADSKFFDKIMEIISTGIIKDGNGIEVNIKNWIIFYTTNEIKTIQEIENMNKTIGFGVGKEEIKISKEKLEENIIEKLKVKFRNEFLGRISKFILFNELSNEDYKKILQIKLKEFNYKLKEKGFKKEMKLKKEEIEKIIKKVKSTGLGGRGIIKEIDKEKNKFLEELI